VTGVPGVLPPLDGVLDTFAGVLGAVVDLPNLELEDGVLGIREERHGVPEVSPKLPFVRWSMAVWTLSLHT